VQVEVTVTEMKFVLPPSFVPRILMGSVNTTSGRIVRVG